MEYQTGKNNPSRNLSFTVVDLTKSEFGATTKEKIWAKPESMIWFIWNCTSVN